jgi:hypothetical protein
VEKQDSSKTAENRRTESKREHKCQRKLVKSTRSDTSIGHRTFLSIQPSIIAMRHNTLNTLDKVTISRADSSMITRFLSPQKRRQRRGKGTEGNSADKPVASKSKPTVK